MLYRNCTKNLSSESENEENSSINIDSQHSNTSGRRSQKRNKKMRKSQELTSLSQNDHNKEIAKDGKVWTTVPSDNVSLGRRQQHNVLREMPGPCSFAIRYVTLGDFTSA
ncbi:hypothetical protein AVEN_235260-1 [Araneus ventricosus]|uniref:Uncharacterized protein n=1 Tax=Araneus ventricosus TaxID=182803 RepID=A0A4Y2A3J5_ARAVE|nr:hypothetical protein AVEN_235260-1 [Araneus ventricosus]